MTEVELEAAAKWRRTGNPRFPVAARVDDRWWVLRLNTFPDHPAWTLFVGGERRFDVEDVPRRWGTPASSDLPMLDAAAAEEALEPVHGFVAYGSEVGQPCDNTFCCG